MLRLPILLAATLLVAAPATAQTAEGAWTLDATTLRAPLAGVAFPRTIAGLTLTETKEFSRKGEKLDNVAEYKSADRQVWGTIYLYRPGYPDAALAAYVTDRSLPDLYGPGLRRLSQANAAFGGVANGAIRTTYTGGILKGSPPLASAAAYARIGGWLVKLRVSGPATRQGEVETALDAMLAGARLEGGAKPFETQPLRLGAPCPAAPTGPVALLPATKEISPDALGMAMAIAAEALLDGKSKDKVPPAFPANGLTPACIRGTIATGSAPVDILQPAGTTEPETILVVLNDVDDVVALRRNFVGKGYSIVKTNIGGGVIGGTVDRLPDAEQLKRLFGGDPPGALTMRAGVSVKADGKTDLNIVTPKK